MGGLRGPDPASPLPSGVAWVQTDISHNENSALFHIDVRRCIVNAAANIDLNSSHLADLENMSSDTWSHVATATADDFDTLREDRSDIEDDELRNRLVQQG